MNLLQAATAVPVRWVYVQAGAAAEPGLADLVGGDEAVRQWTVAGRGNHAVVCPVGVETYGEMLGAAFARIAQSQPQWRGSYELKQSSLELDHRILVELLGPLMRVSSELEDKVRCRAAYRGVPSLAALWRVGVAAAQEGLELIGVNDRSGWQRQLKEFARNKHSAQFSAESLLRSDDFELCTPNDLEGLVKEKIGLLQHITLGMLSNQRTGELEFLGNYHLFFRHCFSSDEVVLSLQNEAQAILKFMCNIHPHWASLEEASDLPGFAMANVLCGILRSNEWEPRLTAGRGLHNISEGTAILRDVLWWLEGDADQRTKIVKSHIFQFTQDLPLLTILSTNAKDTKSKVVDALEVLKGCLAPEVGWSRTLMVRLERELIPHQELLNAAIFSGEEPTLSALSIVRTIRTIAEARGPCDQAILGSKLEATSSNTAGIFLGHDMALSATAILFKPGAQPMLQKLCKFSRQSNQIAAKFEALVHVLAAPSVPITQEADERQPRALIRRLCWLGKVPTKFQHRGLLFVVNARSRIFQYIVLFTAFGESFPQMLENSEKKATDLLGYLDDHCEVLGTKFIDELMQGSWATISFYQIIKIIQIVESGQWEAHKLYLIGPRINDDWLDSSDPMLYREHMPRLLQAIGFIPVGLDSFNEIKKRADHLSISLNLQTQSRTTICRLESIMRRAFIATGRIFREALFTDDDNAGFPQALSGPGGVSLHAAFDQFAADAQKANDRQSLNEPCTDRHIVVESPQETNKVLSEEILWLEAEMCKEGPSKPGDVDEPVPIRDSSLTSNFYIQEQDSWWEHFPEQVGKKRRTRRKAKTQKGKADAGPTPPASQQDIETNERSEVLPSSTAREEEGSSMDIDAAVKRVLATTTVEQPIEPGEADAGPTPPASRQDTETNERSEMLPSSTVREEEGSCMDIDAAVKRVLATTTIEQPIEPVLGNTLLDPIKPETDTEKTTNESPWLLLTNNALKTTVPGAAHALQRELPDTAVLPTHPKETGAKRKRQKENKQIKVLEFFAGIGIMMFMLVAMGAAPGGFVEWNTNSQQVLQMLWPNAKSGVDFYEKEWMAWEAADIIVAGFECTPFSGAGKQKGKLDKRSTQLVDIAAAAHKLGINQVFLENVDEILNHKQVLRDGDAAFDKIGFIRQGLQVITHSQIGGATARIRLIMIYERKSFADKLPQLIMPKTPLSEPGCIRDYLMPEELVPEESYLQGVFEEKEEAVTKKGYQQIGHLHWTHEPLEKGALVSTGDGTKWRIMVTFDPLTMEKVELMKSMGRGDNRRKWVLPAAITYTFAQKIPVYNIDMLSKSIRGWGEWPVRNAQLVRVDTALGKRIRALTPKECWDLQELPEEIYDRACDVLDIQDQVTMTDAQEMELYRMAGSSIPQSILKASLAMLIARARSVAKMDALADGIVATKTAKL